MDFVSHPTGLCRTVGTKVQRQNGIAQWLEINYKATPLLGKWLVINTDKMAKPLFRCSQ